MQRYLLSRAWLVNQGLFIPPGAWCTHCLVKVTLQTAGNLKTSQCLGMGNCVQLRFPHLQQKYLALAPFSLLPWFYYLWYSTAEDRGVCIFKCSLPIKLTANFSLTGSLFCIRALYQQNSLPRIHSSLLQLIATYSFINLDTVTPLARFLAKRNLCISLCIELLCLQSCVQYIRLCTGKISWAS